MNNIRWAIVGTGYIANSFAQGMQAVNKAYKRKNLYERKGIRRDFFFRRQFHLQIAVTYVCVRSFICKLISLPCRLSCHPVSVSSFLTR